MTKRELAHELHAIRTFMLSDVREKPGGHEYLDTVINAIASECGLALADLIEAQDRGKLFADWVERKIQQYSSRWAQANDN